MRPRSCFGAAVIAASVALAACGSQQRQDANEPSGTFPVQITAANWPSAQRLAQRTHLVIDVRNAGAKAIPNVAVTITDPKRDTSVEAFAQYLSMPGLASHSRAVWVVDKPPGQCKFSCLAGGPGGAVTAYSNTWALGRLAPGQTAKFDWVLTAVAPGTHVVQYQVAAGLNGKAKARLSGGGIPKGTFTVRISSRPTRSFVTNSGQIVTTH